MGTTIILELPERISEVALRKAREAALLAFWEAGELSASRTAEELGLSAHAFLDLLAARGRPIVRDFDPEAVETAKSKMAAADHP